MSLINVLGTITIIAGSNLSSASLNQSVFGQYNAIGFVPSGNLAGTATLMGTASGSAPTLGTWVTVKAPAGNVVTVSANNGAFITQFPFDGMQFSASVAQSATTTITVLGQAGVRSGWTGGF